MEYKTAKPMAIACGNFCLIVFIDHALLGDDTVYPLGLTLTLHSPALLLPVAAVAVLKQYFHYNQKQPL